MVDRPLSPVLRRRQKQADLCEFKASLVYRASSRTAKSYTEKLCLEKNTNKQNKQTKKIKRRGEGSGEEESLRPRETRKVVTN